MTDDLDLARALARAPRTRVATATCPACGMPLQIRAGRDLRDECAAAGTAFLWKQWGRWAPKTQSFPYDRDEDGRTVFRGARPPPAAPWGCLSLDGTYHAGTTCWNGRDDVVAPDGGHEVYVYDLGPTPAGKKAGGRQLDGVEHNGRPAFTGEVPHG